MSTEDKYDTLEKIGVFFPAPPSFIFTFSVLTMSQLEQAMAPSVSFAKFAARMMASSCVARRSRTSACPRRSVSNSTPNSRSYLTSAIPISLPTTTESILSRARTCIFIWSIVETVTSAGSSATSATRTSMLRRHSSGVSSAS